MIFCRLGASLASSELKVRSSSDRLGNPLITCLDTLVSRIITFAHLDSERERRPSRETRRSMVMAEQEEFCGEIES